MKKSEIKKVWINDDCVHISTNDGREAKEFFHDYPRLRNASKVQKKNFEINAFGIHWPDLDEDLSFAGFFDKTESEVAELIKAHSVLNVSALARRMKIPQPLFAAYISGVKRPSKNRINKIKEEIRKIGLELIATK
jgi:hypothetical protein